MAHHYLDQMLALMGLTREHPETAPGIPAELLERNAPLIAELGELMSQHLGVGSPMDN
jgi:hypothetical protein